MTDQPSPGTGTRRESLILLLGIILAYLIVLLPSEYVGRLHLGYYDKLLYSRFVYWADVLLLVLFAYSAEKRPLLIWKEEHKRDAGFFAVSVIVLYLINFACGIVSNIPRLFGYHESDAVLKLVAQILQGKTGMIIFISLTAGVTEELIFRGYVLTRLSMLFKNNYLPVIISAIMFSSLHYRYHTLKELIFAFLIGMVFGIYYQKYRNIKVLIVVHFLIDLISLELATHFVKYIK